MSDDTHHAAYHAAHRECPYREQTQERDLWTAGFMRAYSDAEEAYQRGFDEGVDHAMSDDTE